MGLPPEQGRSRHRGGTEDRSEHDGPGLEHNVKPYYDSGWFRPTGIRNKTMRIGNVLIDASVAMNPFRAARSAIRPLGVSLLAAGALFLLSATPARSQQTGASNT
jgi:hypothetical protein